MPREHIIDDSNWQAHANELTAKIGGRAKGRIARDYERVAYGSMADAPAFPFEITPRSEWSARIKELEERKTRMSDLMKFAGVPSLNQARTNYCWCNAVITAIYGVRAAMGLPFVELSPASVAAIIKNFRNIGGYGGEAIAHIADKGVTRASLWPPNAIDTKYYTEEAKADALTHRVTKWYDLKPRNFDQMMTCLFEGFPVPKGHNWWEHEVCGVDPVEIEPGHFGTRDRNSWGPDYGDDGYFVMAERQSTPDDAVCAVVFDANPA